METVIATRLKLKRKEKGLKQAEVAERLGIVQSTYAYYETGRNEPDIETLSKLADIFETTLDYLAGRTNQ
jgi:transcriptional regulator with XRE-family HTH domain